MKNDNLNLELIKKQTNHIIEFLKLIHPSLGDSHECIELRPIPRIKSSYVRSINLWNYDDKSITRLKKFLIKHYDSSSCLYYSVFSFDYEKQSFLKNGKPASKGKINNDNAAYTEEIVLDFDEINHDDFVQYKSRIEDIGIDGLWVNSGHGYQFHILLKHKVYNKNILKDFVDLFIGCGFKCDPLCIDSARIMRLPYTYNRKCLSDPKYEHEKENPPFTYIEHASRQRYDVDTLITLLTPHIKASEQKKKTKKKTTQPNSPKVDSVALQKMNFRYISQYSIPEPINKMLNSTKQGFRNKTLGFLIRYFKTYLKLGKDQMEEILLQWGKQSCNPPYNDEEFKEDFSRFYYYNGLNYDSALAKEFGYIDFENMNLITKQHIFLPNAILSKMNTIDGNALRCFLAIKLLEHLEKQTDIDALAKLLKITTRALRPAINKLTSDNYVYVLKGNRRLKEPNRYFTTKITDLSKGYLKLSFNDTKSLIDELSIGELKLYLFMSYRFFNGKCFMSQNNIGKNIGLEQNTISELTKKLEEKYFIRITKTPLAESKTGNFLFSCTYTLLR